MMNTALQTQIELTDNMKPEEAMRFLSGVHQSGMKARSKVYAAGSMAIHNAYCKFTAEVERRQELLLADHPELVMMYVIED